VEDSANDVGTGVRETRKLIERDQVSFHHRRRQSESRSRWRSHREKKVRNIVSADTPIRYRTAGSWNVFRVCNSTTMAPSAIASTLIEKFGKKWYF